MAILLGRKPEFDMFKPSVLLGILRYPQNYYKYNNNSIIGKAFEFEFESEITTIEYYIQIEINRQLLVKNLKEFLTLYQQLYHQLLNHMSHTMIPLFYIQSCLLIAILASDECVWVYFSVNLLLINCILQFCSSDEYLQFRTN